MRKRFIIVFVALILTLVASGMVFAFTREPADYAIAGLRCFGIGSA